MMFRAVCVLALVTGCALRVAAQPSQPELIERASGYVGRFLAAFSNVAAEEHYEQEATVAPRRRTLRSELLLVRYPGTNASHVFRDVLEKDGRMVAGARDGRLAALFLGPAEQALPRAQEIAAAGARHNIHDIGTLNNPLLALTFLQRGFRERFRFTLTTLEPSLGPTIRTVQFEEVRVPTLLRLGGNLNMPARGHLWIDETNGRVVKTELRVGERDVARSSMTWRPPSTITTTFGLDEKLGIDVPLEMRDHYALEKVEIHGVATYSRFRRFPAGPTGAVNERDDEPLRPRFHFTPARNFMNDPNGLVFYKGEYHLFYQHNPFGETWGHMSWGHAVSPDMLHWQHLPVALREEQGVMIFSGSVVVDWHNSSGFCEAQGGRSFVPGRRLHRAWARPADAEPRLQQRPRPDVDEVREESGHRPRPEGLQGPEDVLARADAALDHGHRAAGSAQGAILRVARSQVVDTLERLRSGGRHRRRVGMSRPLRAAHRG